MANPSAPAHVRRPEMQQTFDHLARAAAEVDISGLTDPSAIRLAVARGVLRRYGDIGAKVSLEGVAFTPVDANGVKAEWVVAEGASAARRILYIHGGGWNSGSPLDYRPLSASLARLCGASILMVDYRLAPENKFPAGLNDCVTAFDWVLANGPTSARAGLSGRDPAERVSVVGDSAGGNLSAALCVRLAARGGRMPDRLALIAGTLDNASAPDRIGADDLICTPETLSSTMDYYLSPTDNAADPQVSPVFAPTALLEKFPPTLLQVGTSEALLYDSKRFADRLERAQVRVALSLWPNVPHVWHGLQGLFPEALEGLAEIADFVRR